MALLFGMFSSWIVILRKLAARKHDRLKKNYEAIDKSFRSLERECKNDEVAVGRPAAYKSQLKLMKLYESLDTAKHAWIKSKKKLAKRETSEEWIRSLQGRKIPYTFGLLDMAIVVKGIDLAREYDRIDLTGVLEFVQSFVS